MREQNRREVNKSGSEGSCEEDEEQKHTDQNGGMKAYELDFFNTILEWENNYGLESSGSDS